MENPNPTLWEIALDNGWYEVEVSVGDPSFFNDSDHDINVEGTDFIFFDPVTNNRLNTLKGIVQVSDRKLTLDPTEGVNTKINYISIRPVEALQINFQDEATIPPVGWLRDFGQAYGTRTDTLQGFGLSYGWFDSSGALADLTNRGRNRGDSPELNALEETFMHMQNPVSEFPDSLNTWEIAVEEGWYEVEVSVGDPTENDSQHDIDIEGGDFIYANETINDAVATATGIVYVNDGKLTLDPHEGHNTKINYITIRPIDRLQVNFQDPGTTPPAGWLRDYGQSYGLRTDSTYQGHGLTYGWTVTSNNGTDLVDKGRNRAIAGYNALQNTLMHMQFTKVGFWGIAVPNANYLVDVSVGESDPQYVSLDRIHSIIVEGDTLIDEFATKPDSTLFHTDYTTVAVSDGILNINTKDNSNTKINYATIEKAPELKVTAFSIDPSGMRWVVEGWNLGGSLDSTSIDTNNIYLEAKEQRIPATVSYQDDQIILTPGDTLDASQAYTFHLGNQVAHTTGQTFLPFSYTYQLDALQDLPQLDWNTEAYYITLTEGDTQDFQLTLNTTDGNAPDTIQLSANPVVSWLRIGTTSLQMPLNYTGANPIRFQIDATNLTAGTYTTQITASAKGYQPAEMNITLVLSPAAVATYHINFQDASTTPPNDWLIDSGEAFGTRSPAPDYGWLEAANPTTPLDLTGQWQKQIIKHR